MKVHDLSFAIEKGMPYFQGDPIPQVNQFKQISKDGYNVKEIHLGTHTGTHVDAPSHFIPGGKTIDKFSPLELSGIATCIDYDPGVGVRLPREKFPVILLYTGYNEKWREFSTFKGFSYISPKDAEMIREYGAKLVGIDSPSAEKEGSTDFETHHILLGGGIPIIENLNSRELKNIVDKTFYLLAIPLVISEGDGSPMRVIALEM